MSTILVTIGRIAEGGEDALRRYAEGTMPIISAFGGTVVSRLRPTETVVGLENGDRPDLVAVIRFESENTIRAFLDSTDYQKQEIHRDAAFSQIHSYIAAEL